MRPLELLFIMLLGAGIVHAPAAQPTGLADAEREIGAFVDSHNSEALDLLERAVNINSGTMNFEGVRQVGQLFREELDALGFETRWSDGTTWGRAGQLVAERRGDGPHLLLIGHLDTVFELDSPFQEFEMLNDSTARGPGAIDMKGGNVIIVQALKALQEVDALDDLHVTVVMMGDEEKSGRPLSAARGDLIEAAKAADIAIGFEDGDGNPRTAVISRRGWTGWTLRVHGRPAHSSQIFQEEVGAGAIFEAARILSDLYDELSDEANLSFNPGLIAGGAEVAHDAEEDRVEASGKINIVAEHAVVPGDIRALSLEQLERVKERMREIVAESLPHTSAEIEFEDSYPPMAPTGGNRRLLSLYDQVSRDLGLGAVEAVDPRNAGAADVSFTAEHVAMAIDGLGLMGSGGHTVEETADLRTLPSQTKRAAVFMYRIAQGALDDLGSAAGAPVSPAAAGDLDRSTRADAVGAGDDPFLWLEEVEGDRALTWVEAHNEAALEELQDHPSYDSLYAQALRILDSDDRIAYPSIRGDYLYNFWQDGDHERGIWRRTEWSSYLEGNPAWEIMLDIDSLAEAENADWSFGGADCLPPEYDRCLISLSRGGADAAEVREFDVSTGAFLGDGFFLPEAKGGAAWIDENTLLVATDFGEGSLTTSGYPRVVKRWSRGSELSDAVTVFEGAATDVGSWGYSVWADGKLHPFIAHRPSFFEGTYYALRGDDRVALDLPRDADPHFVGEQIVVYLRSDWERGGVLHPQGALIASDYEDFLAGDAEFTTVISPSERQTIESVSTTNDYVLVSLLDNVVGELHRFRLEDGNWVGEQIETPSPGTVGVVSTSDADNRFFFTYSSFIQPTTLYFVDGEDAVQPIRSLPDQFDADGLEISRHEAVSDDGTRIPYFVVREKGAPMTGDQPTLLYGYGGFQVSLTSSYSATRGKAWIERGGTYVVANIRGGGEFGPAWHRAAQKEHRQRAFDDFIAVAEDLIDRGITSPEHLGIMGGSNGGLLVGAALIQRPDLFGAAVIAVPLLDMKRYNKLLAGASWMAEYGDPDVPEEWAYISQYSPYHNVREDAEYPRVLFTTTTRDDRVHPGHARKMAARMESLGHPVVYFENTEGGHGSGVTHEQQAKMTAVTYAYLWAQLD